MRYYILLIFILLQSTIGFSQRGGYYMNHISNSSVSIYNANVNLRSSSSIKSKVIATLNPGDKLQETYTHIRDTINSTPGYWIETQYQNKIAYVWNNLVSRFAFKLHTNTDYRLLIKEESESKIGVKIFHNNQFISHQPIALKANKELSEVFSIGTTHNSDNKEIIVFKFQEPNDFLLYQWDEGALTPFTKKLELPFLNDSQLGYITANNVNIRSEASIKSPIIATLQIPNSVEILNYSFKEDTINNQKGYWSHIKYKHQEAYVWNQFLTPIGAESLKNKEVTFLMKENYLIAIKNGKTIDKIKINGGDNITLLGNLGIPQVEEFITICHYAESCGQTSGDIIYSWNGRKLKYFIDNTGVGDGGLFEGNTTIFPSFINGTRNTINTIYSEGESIDIPSPDLSGTSYNSFYRKKIAKAYTVDTNGKLVPKLTETEKIQTFIEQEFKNCELRYYKTADINKDGIADAFIYMINNKTQNRSTLAIALGNTSGTYKLHSSNNNLIFHDQNDPLTTIDINKNGFQLSIFYSGYYTHPYENCIFKLKYLYNHDINDFQLIQETKLIPSSDDSSWKKELKIYKTNMILFKDSWHSQLSTEN
ncbi:SH3 domain-containing protein [Aquimarina algiphila]|uniref:SH3 domain-containing protein n=1 Tax=Aquimarina algiphila TaxID=2047982 RepID=UPI0024938162|nr:SH3 domain-containing protein [Aquimarina algiphila]